jgi:hypothetical protein
MCRANVKDFAPHMAQASLSTGSRSHLLHVLYREIPFFLNIKTRRGINLAGFFV